MRKEVNCKKCEHSWWTKSKLIWLTCPSCQTKVKTDPAQETFGYGADIDGKK